MTKAWHIVLFRTQPHVGDEVVATVRRLFAGCVGKCDGLKWVRAGSNHSASAFAKGWTEAVVMQFRDRAARDAYLFHPLHREVSAIHAKASTPS